MKRKIFDLSRFNNVGLSKNLVGDFSIYCNSLERLFERRTRIIEMTRFFRNCMPIFIHDGIDWKNYELKDFQVEGFDIYENWKLEGSNNGWWNINLKMGSICNGIGHYHIWKHISENGFKYSIIFEDDAHFVDLDSFIEGLNIFYDFAQTTNVELFKLGSEPGFGHEYPSCRGEHVDNDIETCGYEYNSHAYIVTQSAVNKLLNWGYKECMITTDEFLSYTCYKHPRDDVEVLYGEHKKLQGYKFIESRVEQGASSTEEISHVNTSVDVLKS